MSDLIELTPCPFCGTVPMPENAAGSYVFCHGCAAEGPVANADKNGGAREWNTRALIDTTAERDRLQAKVNGMQALCDDLVGEVEKAVAERTEELRDQVRRYGDQIDTLTAERDALRAQLATARADAVREIRDLLTPDDLDSPETAAHCRYALRQIALIETTTPSAPSPEAVARAAWERAIAVAKAHGASEGVIEALRMNMENPVIAACVMQRAGVAKAGGGE